jgi:hypothetical protein
MWAHLLAAAIGIYLMAAPALLGYAGFAEQNDHIAGPLAATVAITALWQCTRGIRWINVFIGLWLFAAPWLLGYDSLVSTLNSTISGVLLSSCSLVKGKLTKHFNGGWSALWKAPKREPT